MRRTLSWNASPPRLQPRQRPQQPSSSFMLVVLPPPSAFFTPTALRAALPTYPTLGSIVAAAASVAAGAVDADGTPCGPASQPRSSFICSNGCLLYLRSPCGDRLCILEAGWLRVQVLQELHSTPLGGPGHIGRDITVTRRWHAASCGGPACPVLWRSTS